MYGDMVSTITIRPQQLHDLREIVGLGKKVLSNVVSHLQAIETTLLKPGQLERELSNLIPDKKKDIVENLTRQILSLFALKRSNDFSPSEIIDGLTSGLNQVPEAYRWNTEYFKKWKSICPELEELIRLDSLRVLTKVIDLSYEYENLYQRSKIILDVRPIYDEEATSIVGSVVAFSLGITYDSNEGDHYLSLSLDIDDIQTLHAECERALNKAVTAKKTMQEQAKIPTVISGED